MFVPETRTDSLGEYLKIIVLCKLIKFKRSPASSASNTITLSHWRDKRYFRSAHAIDTDHFWRVYSHSQECHRRVSIVIAVWWFSPVVENKNKRTYPSRWSQYGHRVCLHKSKIINFYSDYQDFNKNYN